RRAALVAGDMEAPGVAARVCPNRIEVRHGALRGPVGHRSECMRAVWHKRLSPRQEAVGYLAVPGKEQPMTARLRYPLLLSMIVLAAMVVAAAGCGGGDNNKKTSGGTANVPKTLTVGSDIPYTPFEFGQPPYKG